MRKVLEWIKASLPGVPMLAGAYIAVFGAQDFIQILGAGIAVWQGSAFVKNVIKLLTAKTEIAEQESS